MGLPLAARDLPDNRVSKRAVLVNLDGDATVYAINRVRQSTDAFLALPVDALGTRYRVVAYRSVQGSSQVAVAATADGTEVRIWPSAPVRGAPTDGPIVRRIDRGQVYSLVGAHSSADLTGTSIEASAPVAVMAGAKCAYVPPQITACDHLTQMIPPLSTWGKRFVTVPIATRKKGDLIRILADTDETRVRIDGTQVASLGAGRFFDRILVDPALIEADRPILVGQYALGSAYDGVVSDPFFTLVPPSEQFLDRYIFATPMSGFRSHFISIVAPTDSLSSLNLDGRPVDGSRFRPIRRSGYSGGALELTPGTHRIEGDGPFGILVYGFDSHDSYGYPGGMAFTRINPLGDRFAPTIAEVSVDSMQLRLRATDSEDRDADGELDSGEDLDGDGVIGPRNEDKNGNRRLDAGEDGNADGIIDRDGGLARVELTDGADNLRLESTPISPGTLTHEFSVVLIDPKLDGSGEVSAIDLAGNRITLPVRLQRHFHARLDEQPPLTLNQIREQGVTTGNLIPRFEQRVGDPEVHLTTDFSVMGAVLEIDSGDGWQPLGRQAHRVQTSSDDSGWPVRVRTGRCVGGVRPGEYRIFMTTRGTDGVDSNAEVSIDLSLQPTSWWICLRPFLIGLLIVLALALFAYGFIWPARFRPQIGVMLSNEENLEEGFFLLLRAQRGTGIGFYRHARAYVREDYRVCGRPGGAIVQLRADRGRILMRPMPGAQVLWKSDDGRWETLDERESRARVGTLYRNDAGTLYFMLRSR
ncbi:MAG: hypothetical protein LGR52_00970 [Candidatus Thiosymbion ectosymbiont of Robbea hypermnestra]|nr:hypothetical protein [Candidatus Thiosymbion ectosymbiont of Robbea hypermnestra]